MDHHGVSRWRLSAGFGEHEFDDDDDDKSHKKEPISCSNQSARVIEAINGLRTLAEYNLAESLVRECNLNTSLIHQIIR